MHRRIIRCSVGIGILLVALAGLLIPGRPLSAQAGGIGLAGYVARFGALAADGSQPNFGALNPSLSSDGRFLAFSTFSTNMGAPSPVNSNVYVRDRASGIVELMSVGHDGTAANGSSLYSSISGDGELVAFTSQATNLTGPPSGPCCVWQILFLRDRASDITQLVSHVYYDPNTAATGYSYARDNAFSSDNRWIAFSSTATDLVSGQGNGDLTDVFLYDRLLDSSIQVSTGMAGAVAFGRSGDAQISQDGRFVVFASDAWNLVPDDENNTYDIFVFETATGILERVSIASNGDEAVGESISPGISGDGRLVVFQSHASNLVPGDTNGLTDVFLHDRVTGETRRLSKSESGQQGNGPSGQGKISADGRYAIFTSTANNFVAGDSNNSRDIFHLDLQSGALSLITVDHQGLPHPGGPVEQGVLSPDGRVIAYSSEDPGIVPGDTNGYGDVFIYGPSGIHFQDGSLFVAELDEALTVTVTLEAPWPVTATVPYSTADGSATSPADYTHVNGVLTFPPGVTAQTFTVPVVDEGMNEVDETFQIRLGNATGGIMPVPPSVASVTIEDSNGPSISLESRDPSISETDTLVPFSATLSMPSVQTVTIDYESVPGSATPGSDYTPVAGTLTFSPGTTTASFQVEILEEFLEEADESFTVALENPDNGTLGTPASLDLIIENDDGIPVSAPVVAPPDHSEPVTVTLTSEFGTIFITLTEVISDGVLTATVLAGSLADPPTPYITLPTYVFLESDGFAFAHADIRLPYLQTEVNALELPEASLRLLARNGASDWRDTTTAITTNSNMISGRTEVWGTFVTGQMPIPECAVTIINGATHTGRRTVNLFSQVSNAAEMLVSNDAGFPGATWRPYTTNLSWTLTNPGPQISTLLAYVRVRNSNGQVLCGGLTLSDDIIYDPLPPELEVVARRAPSGGYTLTLEASDQQNGSGVAQMQVSMHSGFVGAAWQPFSPQVTVDGPEGATVFVRVRDGVGNRSATVHAALGGAYKLYLPSTRREP